MYPCTDPQIAPLLWLQLAVSWDLPRARAVDRMSDRRTLPRALKVWIGKIRLNIHACQSFRRVSHERSCQIRLPVVRCSGEHTPAQSDIGRLDVNNCATCQHHPVSVVRVDVGKAGSPCRDPCRQRKDLLHGQDQ